MLADRVAVGLVAAELALLIACAPAAPRSAAPPKTSAAPATARGGYDEVTVFLDCTDGRKPDGGACDPTAAGTDPTCGCPATDLMCAMKCSAAKH